MLRASLIVRTLNEARYLPVLLDALSTQSVAPAEREVIVVDSGSTDATLAIAERHQCRILHIDRHEFSFGRSLNVGCAEARGAALVFVSGHCVPASPEWLSRLLQPIEDREAVLTYGRQKGGKATRFSEDQIFRKYFPDPTGVAPNGFFCNNANAALRRDVWEAHRFDESLTGLEDLHLGKRVVQAGMKIRYVPEAAVFHHHEESWRQVKRRFEREALALQAIMPEIHVSTATALRYFTVAVINDWKKASLERRLFANAWPIVAYRFCQYYGSWKGNHGHRRLSREARERYFYPQ